MKFHGWVLQIVSFKYREHDVENNLHPEQTTSLQIGTFQLSTTDGNDK